MITYLNSIYWYKARLSYSFLLSLPILHFFRVGISIGVGLAVIVHFFAAGVSALI